MDPFGGSHRTNVVYFTWMLGRLAPQVHNYLDTYLRFGGFVLSSYVQGALVFRCLDAWALKYLGEELLKSGLVFGCFVM